MHKFTNDKTENTDKTIESKHTCSYLREILDIIISQSVSIQ